MRGRRQVDGGQRSAPALGTVLLALLFLIPGVRAQLPEIDKPVLTRAGDLEVFSDVLHPAAESRRRVEQLMECLPLWRTCVVAMPPAAGEFARFEVVFEFGVRERRHARVYRLSFTTVKSRSDQERFVASAAQEGFEDLTLDWERPSFASVASIDVLRMAAAKREFLEGLRDWMTEGFGEGRGVTQFTISPSGTNGRAEVYTLSFQKKGLEGQPGTITKNWLAYAEPDLSSLTVVAEDEL
jgi:hypothetical protein